jgi:UDP-glucuronate 4-epimerase
LRAVVTGVAGFIGSRLAERLLEAGDSVLGVDRFSSYYDESLKRRNVEGLQAHERFELIEDDLNAIELVPLLDAADVVLHLAAQPGIRSSWGTEFDVYVNDNVLATQRLLEAARETGLGRLVLASSSSVYGAAERFPVVESDAPRPISPYGVTKLSAEHLCRLYSAEFSVPTVILRYFTIFGPRQRPDMAFCRFIDAALEGRPVEVFGDGSQSRDFTYVDDAVSATIAAATRGAPAGAIYNVAGGAEATVLDVIGVLEELVEAKIQARHLPAAPGDPRRTGADTTRARSDLGFAPQTSLEEGLARQVEAHRAAYAPS